MKNYLILFIIFLLSSCLDIKNNTPYSSTLSDSDNFIKNKEITQKLDTNKVITGDFTKVKISDDNNSVIGFAYYNTLDGRILLDRGINYGDTYIYDTSIYKYYSIDSVKCIYIDTSLANEISVSDRIPFSNFSRYNFESNFVYNKIPKKYEEKICHRISNEIIEKSYAETIYTYQDGSQGVTKSNKLHHTYRLLFNKKGQLKSKKLANFPSIFNCYWDKKSIHDTDDERLHSKELIMSFLPDYINYTYKYKDSLMIVTEMSVIDKKLNGFFKKDIYSSFASKGIKKYYYKSSLLVMIEDYFVLVDASNDEILSSNPKVTKYYYTNIKQLPIKIEPF